MEKYTGDRPVFGTVAILEPAGGTTPAPMHKTGDGDGHQSPNNPAIMCDTGYICASGTGAGSGRITDVKGIVLRAGDPIPDAPPPKATQGSSISSRTWQIDNIGGAEGDPTDAAGTAPQNQIVVWVTFANELVPTRTFKPFFALSGDHTACEHRKAKA